jgi:hypothetical protein
VRSSHIGKLIALFITGVSWIVGNAGDQAVFQLIQRHGTLGHELAILLVKSLFHHSHCIAQGKTVIDL